MVSLADRRKSRGPLISEGNDHGGELDKLKQNAEGLLDREKSNNLLEEISEEDIPDAEEEDLGARGRGGTGKG